jgi:23S rRNA (cytidine1920-2'-O)/16S rRNA (cytidine1409-2'-O)-methyltransferase
LENTDVRSLTGRRYGLVVVDLSFISVAAVAEHLASLLEPGGDLLVLVKPQYEAGKGRVGRGVVRDPKTRQAAVDRAKGCFDAAGLDTVGELRSPVTGEHGNEEMFLWLRHR